MSTGTNCKNPFTGFPLKERLQHMTKKFIDNVAADPNDRYFPVNAYKERKMRIEYAEKCLHDVLEWVGGVKK